MDIVQYKKKVLSCKQFIRQQTKGTLDSPCLSACSRDSNGACLTCGLIREEKKGWSTQNDIAKEKIRRACRARLDDMRKTAEDEVAL